jgi:hypothetical protein
VFYLSTIFTHTEITSPGDNQLVKSTQRIDDLSKSDKENEEGLSIHSIEIKDSDSGNEDLKSESTCEILSETKLIYGAIGFIPDDYQSISEIEEGRNVTVMMNSSKREIPLVPYLKPRHFDLIDILEFRDNLVINESKKYSFKGTFKAFDFTELLGYECKGGDDINEETLGIDYFVSGGEQRQVCGKVRVATDECECVLLVFKNHFHHKDEGTSDMIYRTCLCYSVEEMRNSLGEMFYFIIDMLRVSEDTVIMCLSQVLKD